MNSNDPTNSLFVARRILTVLVLLTLGTPSIVLAHTGAGAGGGFVAGFFHPFSGADHILAMLAVGMWGAQLGNPALWVLPVAFPLMMTVGGVLGISGVPLPGLEVGIALSVIVLGTAIAFSWRPHLYVAMGIVAFFAIFHGYAHGAELPGQAGAIEYSAGFVLATGLLHLTGIGIGFMHELRGGKIVLRVIGAAVGVAGVVLLAQV